MTITDRHIKFKPDFSSETRYIDLRDVKSISPTLSITILSAFIPIPDCIVIEMKDGAYHHFSVGRFGMLFGQRNKLAVYGATERTVESLPSRMGAWIQSREENMKPMKLSVDFR